jgi:anti-sigma factor RsiW
MTALSCAEFVELVTAYLDGALDQETADRFAAHTRACQGCERYLEQFRQTIRLVGTLTPDDLPDEARDRMLGAFRTWSRGTA